jgi:G3E family GTPase
MLAARIPLTVVGGYLGAGKTTLVNHILRHNAGRRFAVLVNDFGSINVDADLIAGQTDGTIALTNGCVCCSLAGGFIVALGALREREPPPEHVIVEASGVSDPHKIAQYGYLPGYRLDGTVVVADAEAVRARAADKYVGAQVRQQLLSADLLVLNKTDLVSAADKAAVRDWLQTLVPAARIVEAAQGRVAVPLLLGGDEADRPLRAAAAVLADDGGPAPDATSAGGAASIRGAGPAPARDAGPVPETAPARGHLPAHRPERDYASWSYAAAGPLDGAAFRALVGALPEGVLRGKGVLLLAEDPDQRFVFQLVGKRWSIKRDAAWGDALPGTRLVLLGLPGSLDEARLNAAFSAVGTPG